MFTFLMLRLACVAACVAAVAGELLAAKKAPAPPAAHVYNKPKEDFVRAPYMQLEGSRKLDCEGCKRITRKALESFPKQLYTNRNIAWYNVCEQPKKAEGFPWTKGAFTTDMVPFTEACHGLLQDQTLMRRMSDKLEPFIQTMVCRRFCPNGPGTIDEPYHDPWLPQHTKGPWGYAEYPDRIFNRDEWNPTATGKEDSSGGKRFS